MTLQNTSLVGVQKFKKEIRQKKKTKKTEINKSKQKT